MSVAEPTTQMSRQLAQELHPIAVRQARQGMVVDLLAAAIIVTAATAMWLAGWPGFGCVVASAVGGGPATVRGIVRWRRLRRMRPTEAAECGEL